MQYGSKSNFFIESKFIGNHSESKRTDITSLFKLFPSVASNDLHTAADRFSDILNAKIINFSHTKDLTMLQVKSSDASDSHNVYEHIWRIQVDALLVKNDTWEYVNSAKVKPEIVEGDAVWEIYKKIYKEIREIDIKRGVG